MNNWIKVCQDILVYLEEHAKDLPEGSRGTFRGPEVLRDRLKVELDAQGVLGKSSKRTRTTVIDKPFSRTRTNDGKFPI